MIVYHVEAGDGERCSCCTATRRARRAGVIRSRRWRHTTASSPPTCFGRSDPADSPATYDAEVERIDRLADSFGLNQFNLVAHDYGGSSDSGYVLRHPDRVMRLALLNTRAHNIFRPWFYRFSLGQRWAAVHAPAIVRRLPLRRLHHVALRPYRTLGCFDDALENEYLGWMDTARDGAPSSSSSRTTTCPPCPTRRRPRADRLPHSDRLGDRYRYIPFATAGSWPSASPARR